MKITRTFTRDELEELDITAGGDTVVSDEIVDQRRWSVVHHIVFRHDDGTLWQVTYYEPATENQECDPWGYRDSPDPVEAVQVEAYEVAVTKYRPVDPAREPGTVTGCACTDGNQTEAVENRCAHCGDVITLIDGTWTHRPGLRSPHDPEPANLASH